MRQQQTKHGEFTCERFTLIILWYNRKALDVSASLQTWQAALRMNSKAFYLLLFTLCLILFPGAWDWFSLLNKNMLRDEMSVWGLVTRDPSLILFFSCFLGSARSNCHYISTSMEQNVAMVIPVNSWGPAAANSPAGKPGGNFSLVRTQCDCSLGRDPKPDAGRPVCWISTTDTEVAEVYSSNCVRARSQGATAKAQSRALNK